MRVAFLILFLVLGGSLVCSDVDDFELEQLLDIKVSTASKYEQTILEAPSSVTIITADDIKRFGYKTLAEALSQEKSFYTRNDRVYQYMGVRGLDLMTSYNNTILLMLDGHILNDNIYGGPFFGNELCIDLNLIERIEIVRGPGSSLYGNGAMISVINLITKSGQKVDGMGLVLNGGSYGRKEGHFYFGTRLNSGVDIVLSGTVGDVEGQDLYFKEYDDSLTNFGWAQGLDWERFYGFNARISYKNFSFSTLFSSREKGIPTGVWEMNFNEREPKAIDSRAYFNLGYKYQISERAKMDINAFFDYYGYKGTYAYDTLDYDSDDGKWFGLEWKLNWDISHQNVFLAGFEFRNNIQADYRLWNELGIVIFDKNFPYNVYSAYIQDYHQVLSWLGLNIGVRYDYYTTSGGSVNPRVGLIMNLLEKSAFKFILGTSYRAPNIYEMYYTDNRTAIPNPNLKPEKLTILEAIYEHEIISSLFGSFSYFNMNMFDMIYQREVTPDSMLQFQNLDEVRVNGFEMAIRYKYSNRLSSYLNMSYQVAENKNTGERLENSPRFLLKFGANYQFFDFLNVAGEVRYEEGRLSANRNKVAPYWLANLYCSADLPITKWIGKGILENSEIYFKINNVFDKKYGLPCGADHRQDLIPQDGRNFLLGVNLKF